MKWIKAPVAAIFCVWATSAAPAQAPTPKGDFGAAPAEQAQDPWKLDCGEAGGSCRMLQTVIIRETGQPLLTAALESRPAGDAYSLVLKVPHGILLPPGMSLETTGIERMVLRYRLSDATGVFAATRVSQDLLEALKAGDMLKVTVVTAGGQKVGIPVTLRGFARALERLEANL